jgi:hypothetical protein
VALNAPANWAVLTGRPPLVVTIGSGRALVAVWRYPRSEPLPGDPAALDRARTALIGAARARDPRLAVIRSKLVTVGTSQGVELDATEFVQGQLRRVRSVHLFAYGAEIVLDEYAPPSVFHAVDHAVFSPVKRSLRLSPATGA